MEDIRYPHLLSYYNTSSGVRPIISKLLSTSATNGQREPHGTRISIKLRFPLKFLELLQFIRETAKIMNNPCFDYDPPPASVGIERKILVSTKKTDTRDERPERGVSVSACYCIPQCMTA